MSLRARLNLMIAFVMLLIVGVGAVFVVHESRRSVIEEVRSSVNLVMQLIDAGLMRNGDSEAALHGWLQDLVAMETTRHLRIQVRQSPESVIQIPSRDSDAGGKAPNWFVWAVTPEKVFGEKPVELPGGEKTVIRVEANPRDEIDEAWAEASGFLQLLIALAVAIALTVHVTLGRAFKSVNVILQSLESIEKGDYGTRLQPLALPEFARISSAVNHMAATLEQARDENRALNQRSLAIQEEERRHIARELHDELGQSISAVRLMAASLRTPQEPAQTGQTVDVILGICDRLFGVVRNMMRRMRPLILDELGLVASLEDMAETWRACNAGTRLNVGIDPEVEVAAGAAGIHLYRAAQECLTNVSKHARARTVELRLGLDRGAERIVLQIADDGSGFDPARVSDGFGLHGLRERVANLLGEFELETKPGAGCRVCIAIPVAGDVA